MVWVFIAVAADGLFWLRYRNPYRRRWLLPRPAAPPVSSTEAVDRHYRHLLSGGRLGEAVVAAAAARFAELLGSGRVREIERELTPGVGFAVGVRALTRIGTPAAIIETGFLGGDRDFLTGQTGRVAAGIADGVLCFLAPAP